MKNDAAYDISAEIDPVDRLDDVTARLEQRRSQAKRGAEAKSDVTASDSSKADKASESADDEDAETAARKKTQEAARKRKEVEEQQRLHREEELRESRWVTPSYKARETRVKLLDKIYYRMRADGTFTRCKQEFYDEGLAMLEQKYGEYAKAD